MYAGVFKSSQRLTVAQLEVDEVFLNFDSFEAECTNGRHLSEEERKILTAQKTVKNRGYNHWKWADATVGVTDFQRTLAAVWIALKPVMA